MPLRVVITARHAGNADDIFDSALHFDELEAAMAGFAVYEGLPREKAREGATYVTDVTFWGLIKIKGHTMHVEKVDVAGRIIQSREHGGSIKRWDHTLSVQPDGKDAVWTDSVVIDAGWQTPFAARFAAYVYTRRHRHRGALSITRRMDKDTAS